MIDFLVLAHPDDETALRAASGLRRRNPEQTVAIVSAEALAMAPRQVYRQQPADSLAGLTSAFEFELASGLTLRSGEIGVVFNRLRGSDAPHFSAALPADREYAAAELSALWVSWLTGLAVGGTYVINLPGRRGLQPGFSPLEWRVLARHAGLPVAQVRVDSDNPTYETPTSRQNWLVAGEHLCPLTLNLPTFEPTDPPTEPTETRAQPLNLPTFEQKAIRRLQSLSDCRLLELSFTAPTAGDNPPCLVGVNPFPVTSEPQAIALIIEMLEAYR